MTWLDEKYVNLVSPKLERYRIVDRNPFKANFRCPFCGDSQKSKTKARGNVYTSGNMCFYKCFNCGVSTTAEKLLKHVDPTSHKEYIFEKYKSGSKKVDEEDLDLEFEFTKKTKSEPKEEYETLFGKLLDPVKDLPEDHPAVLYLKDRMMPEEKMKEFYYVDDMQKVENLSEKYKNKINGTEERIALPCYNRKGRLIGAVFRALDEHPIKYLSLNLTEDEKMVFNIDTVNLTKDVYVVEGPFDSMFLPNCVAVGSTNLLGVQTHVPLDKAVFIYDNQPRNREVVKIMRKSINAGVRHFVWPSNLESKDLNELIKNRESTHDGLPDLINRNTFGGLELMAKFNDWKRC